MQFISPETIDAMHIQTFAGIEVFRPRLDIELLNRRDAERNLRDGYSSGTYRDPVKINEILQYQFGYFHRRLGEQLPQLASRHLVEFLLHQYGQTSKIELYRKQGKIPARERDVWNRWGPIIRRAIKYVTERVALLEPQEAPRAANHSLLQLIEECTIYAEQLVDLYIQSDQTFMLFPDCTDLTIHPEGTDYYIDLDVRDFNRYDVRPRIERDAQNQSRFFPSLPFHYNFTEHAAILDGAFKDTFGFTWTNAIGVLKQLIDTAAVTDRSFDIPFCHQKMVVEGMSEVFTGGTPESTARFLEGFSLPVSKMQEEGREIWRPKQEYRASRRAFFEFPHKTGPRIVWSREMARECLFMLNKGVVFQRIPPEWKSPSVNAALANLSNKAGKWFEDVTKANVEKVGIIGLKSLKRIGTSQMRIVIPADVGELDFLGYHAGWQMQVLFECKMVDSAYEPTYMRDDISKFVKQDNSHIKKFRRKIDWVRNNCKAVCASLETVIPNVQPIVPARFATAMITLHPSLASAFISDLPCVSLTELMLDIEKQGGWPYTTGVHAC